VDPADNPFTPGAGTPPPELAGRDQELEKLLYASKRALSDHPEQVMLITGLRGVGKTVLLNAAAEEAESLGFTVCRLEASSDEPVPEQFVAELDALEAETDSSRGRKLRAILTALRGAHIAVGPASIGADLDFAEPPGKSAAGSTGIGRAITAIGAELKGTGRGLFVTVDEAQELEPRLLRELCESHHRASQRRYPFVLVVAGLPNTIASMTPAQQYAERMFDIIELSQLKSVDTHKALRQPFVRSDVDFDDPTTLYEAEAYTDNYPFFIQQIGSVLWEMCDGPSISSSDVRNAAYKTTQILDNGLFAFRWERLTKSERKFALSLATLGPGPYSIDHMKSLPSYTADRIRRAKRGLIAKGLAYESGPRLLNWSVPQFTSFLHRNFDVELADLSLREVRSSFSVSHLRVLAATWGSDDVHHNVLATVRSLRLSGRRAEAATQSILGDVDSDGAITLRVLYEYSGRRHHATFAEGATIDLSSEPDDDAA
jgi:hypothetical protein